MRRSTRVAVAIVVVALFALLPAFSVGPARAPAPAAPVAPTTAAAVVSALSGPHPAITCPPPPYPIYAQENGIWPLTPSQRYQGICGYINTDEVHAALFSSQPRSGERFTTTMTLPLDGVQPQANAYLQSWVGMVVKGDRFSQWGQSYAAVYFVPTGAGVGLTYATSFHIFSLINASYYAGGVCPATNLTWNGSFFCESDDYNPTGSATVGGSLPAGDRLSVTFAGDKSSTTGLSVWVNDSTNPLDSLYYVLNSTDTGGFAFEPYFNASCPDFCILNWSMAVGEGMGFSLCPLGPSAFAVCDSYNSTIWQGTHPPEYGIPHFYESSGYTGDFYYFAPVSDSGVCNFILGVTANCNNNAVFGGNGFYPWFTYNGSELDFGSNWTWTTQNWGGASFELLSTANLHDIVPLYFYQTTNDSRDGFIDRGRALNVTAWVQDLGTISSVYLNYQVNGGAIKSIPMVKVNGSSSSANYTAEIPVGADGWVNYTLNATNHAGAVVDQPLSGSYHIQRGPLPTFRVGVTIPYPVCGGSTIGGVSYANNSTVSLNPGYYTLFAHACYPYVFQRWVTTRGLTATPTTNVTAILGVSSSGTLSAYWAYVRPWDVLTAYTSPTSCGQVILNGSYLTNGQQPPSPLLDQYNYSLSYLGCAGDSFAGWTFTGNLSILGGASNTWNIEPFSNGTITANFVTTSSADSVLFYTNPVNCGGIAVNGVGYVSGTGLSLLPGSYPIAPDPCYHYGFRPPWVTTGGVSVSGSTMTVSNGGSVTENYYVLTMVTVQISGCGTAFWDTNRVINNAQFAVANNSTHVVAGTPCPGWYLFTISGAIGVSVVGSVATVNASGIVYYTFIHGSQSQVVAFLTDPTGCGAIVFNGVAFFNSNFTYVPPGTVATITAAPCVGYGFLSWVTYGGIQILGQTAWLNGSGAIQAIFQPQATLYVYTSPGTCGSLVIANTSYTTGAILTLTEFKTYPIAPKPCAGYGFSNYVNSSGAQLPFGTSVGAQVVFLSSAAVLTAIYTPILYRVTIQISPANCGGVRLSSQNYGNGTVLSLSGGTYPITATPCTGDHLVRWTTTSNLTVTNTTLWVNGSGTLGALYQPVPPSVTLAPPGSAFAGLAVLFTATVAVPVPPYNYSYAWSFGDGSTGTTTPVSFTSHTYANPGSYVVTVSVTDPYGRTANASGTVLIVPPTTSSVTGLPPTTLAALAVAVIVVLAVIVVGLRMRAASPAAEGPASPMPPPRPPDADLAETTATDVEPPKP